MRFVLFVGMLITLSVLSVEMCTAHVHHKATVRGASEVGKQRLYRGHGCGVGHPAVATHKIPVQTSNQSYVSKQDVRRARGLANQDYGEVLYSTAHEAEEAGLTDSIRITLVWDVIEEGDTIASDEGNPAQCSSAGQTYDYRSDGTWTTSDDPCKAEQVVTITNDRFLQMKQRTEWAKAFWEAGLRLKPVQDDIEVDSSISSSFALDSTTYSDTDLVIIMTARPQPDVAIAGYATCLQTDQYARCTVGQFNWVPSVMNLEAADEPMVVTDERHTAAHEIAHLLGAVIPSEVFRDENGMARPWNDIYSVGEALEDVESRDVSFIKTERVLEVARDAYGCSDAEGVPLEDVPLGRGSHWEARVLGPEFMSYGSGAGEAYVSDLTLAFLEDTNQYVANYSNAGRLQVATATDTTNVNTGPLTSPAIDFDKSKLRKDWSPGYLTYGRKEGCAFLKKRPQKWDKQYTCSKFQEYLCTPDNRLSAVCVMQTGVEMGTNDWSCSEPSRTDPSCTNAPTNDNCDGGVCGIPTEQQFFKSNAEATNAFEGFDVSGVTVTAGNTGGFSASMDYTPVPVGFWSCLDTEGTTNSTGRLEEESEGFDIGELVSGAAKEMSVFGGQTRCKTCRCFVSSLVAFSRLAYFNPLFPRYGLCYVSNCAKENLLQVGIRNQFGGKISWYRCPPEGGKVWIAGFSGSLHCPASKEFCIHENVSGRLYPETNRLLELYIYAALTGVALLLFCVCSAPCFRDRVQRCTTRCCGVTAYEDAERKARKGGQPILSVDPEATPQKPARIPALVLLAVNTITLAAGLFMAGYSIYFFAVGVLVSAVVPAIMLGVFVVVVSAMGVIAANRSYRNISCAMLNYYFLVFFLLLLLVAFGVYASVTDDLVESYVEENFEVIAPGLPDGAYDSSASRADQVDQATAYINQNLLALGIVGFVVASLFLASLIAAGIVIGKQILASTKFAVLSFTSLIMGILSTAMGASYLIQGSMDMVSIGGFAILVGVIGIVIGLIGVYSSWSHNLFTILVTSGLAIVAAIGFLAGVVFAFNAAVTAQETVDSKSEDELAEMQRDFGVSLSRDAFVAYLQDTYRKMGIGFVMVAIAALLLTLAGYFFRTFLIQLLKDVRSGKRARHRAERFAQIS